jgi:hypothetical protein
MLSLAEKNLTIPTPMSLSGMRMSRPKDCTFKLSIYGIIIPFA